MKSYEHIVKSIVGVGGGGGGDVYCMSALRNLWISLMYNM